MENVILHFDIVNMVPTSNEILHVFTSFGI